MTNRFSYATPATLGSLLLALSASCAFGSLGCRSSTPAEPENRPDPNAHAAVPAVTTAAPAAATPTPAPTPAVDSASAAAIASAQNFMKPPAPAAAPVASVPVSPDDPLHGQFSLADATAGLTGKGDLIADIDTELGKLSCALYDDKAPITVANFVGLARGLRPFKGPDGKWGKKPAYDGTTFHRVIKGFMIQGGDPAGTGAGEPGYVIPDEVWPGAKHDQIGQLCMANRGPNTNGQQFFIMDGVAAHLDRGYTIFGKCGPEAVIEKLASVPVQGDHSVTPTKIKKISVRRGKI
ncbi:MAG TPA: peptidylprolyl isomerase [Polyangiaceae bacterium]|jgi:peptidyl-prolyl cis-trans isomerase A (cyclophilin A)